MIQSNHSTTIEIEGKQYLYFGGTNYLGLAHRKQLWEAASQAFERYGFSSGASRLTSGENDLLLALESELAEFASCDAALILPAGFMTNLAVVDGINDLVDYWILSKFAHGSIKSAVAHTGKELFVDDLVVTHPGDQRSLRGRLGLPPNARLGFFAEPIDPLLGTLFHVPDLVHALGASDYLVLDEAHSFAVLGEQGRGALEHFNLPFEHERLIRTGTFSKALGAQGGFILASQKVVDQIKSHSYSYKVSTPLTPVACAASRAALHILRDHPQGTIQALRENILYTNQRLVASGYEQFARNAVPIYHLPGSPGILKLRGDLPGRGMYLPTVTSYFADFCDIGLRWTIQAGHSREHLDGLLDAIATSSPQPKC